MPDTKITDFDAYGDGDPDDILLIVDRSDTSMASSGTDKYIPLAQVGFAGLRGTAAASDPNGPTDAEAIGSGSWAMGEQSFAQGYQCTATTDYSTAAGYQCAAGDPPRACTISGATVTISGGDYTAWFYDGDDGALVLWQLSGGSGPTIAYGSIADGGVAYDGTDTTLALKASATSHTAGLANMRDDAVAAHAEGYDTAASGNAAHAEGSSTAASGYAAHAEGSSTVASETAAHVEGYSTAASAQAAHAEGSSTVASEIAAHAEGSSTIASGISTHAEGYDTVASETAAHAEGSSTVASGMAAHAEGYDTAASETAAHAEGYSTTASGYAAHAEGSSTTATDIAAHAEGHFTAATAEAAHAEGYSTAVSGYAAHAGGRGAAATLLCQWARSDGGTVPGQASQVYVSGRTASADPVALLIGGSDRVAIAPGRAVGFVAQVVAYKTDGSKAATFLRQGLISNVGGTTSLVGAVGTIGTDINAPSWSVAFAADDGNDALSVSATGEATVDWRVRIDFVEVG